MLRFLAICSFAFFVSVNLNAQSLRFKFQKANELPISTELGVSYCYSDHKLYLTNNQFIKLEEAPSDSVHPIYIYNTADGTSDSLNLKLPSGIDRRYRISDIAVSDKYVSLLVDRIYTFDRLDGRWIDSFNSENSDNIVYMTSRRLLIEKNYNSHPKTDSISSKLIVRLVQSKKPEFSIFPTFNYKLYTHLTGQFYTNTRHRVAFAQTLPYQIQIYNDKLIPTGSITRNIPNSDSIIASIDDIHNSSKDLSHIKERILELRSIDSITRIEKIQFLSEDLLMVIKVKPKSSNSVRHIDLWKYDVKIKKWELEIDDQETEVNMPKNDVIISPANVPLYLFVSAKIVFTENNDIYFISKKVAPNLGMPASKYKEYQDEYYSNHDLNYQIWHFKWELSKL